MTSLTYTAVRNYAPDRLGPNLITNPGPFVTTAGYTAVNSATLSVVSGKLRIARNGVNSPGAATSVAVEIGQMYLVTVAAEIGSSPNLGISIDDGAGGVVWIAYPAFTTGKTVSKYVRAETATLTVQVVAINSTGTQYVQWASAQIKKVLRLTHGSVQLVRNAINDEIVQVTDPWVASNCTLSIVANKLRVTNVGAVNGTAYDYVPTVVGRTYKTEFRATLGSAASCALYVSDGTSNILTLPFVGNGVVASGSFVATVTLTQILLQNSPESNATVDYSGVTVTQANSAYTLDTFPARLAPKPNVVGGANIAFSGKEWGYVHRVEKIWQVTTDRFHDDDYALWEEFLESVSVSEVFSIDIKGTSAAPVASVTCVLADKGWSIDRIAAGPYWRASFNVRLL